MTKPLFIWAGGKTRMLKHYKDVMPQRVETYYEPFFGGGAMFLYVLKEYTPSSVVINDINHDIINIYLAIRDDFHNFIHELDILDSEYIKQSMDGRKEFYFYIRNQHAYEYQQWNVTKEAATLYFLMKTGFNGIFQINKNTNGRFGTPSGLLNQQHSVYDKSVVSYWHTVLQPVEICSVDWKKLSYKDDDSAFIFLDPPYRGCYTSYGQTFDDKDQLDLLSFSRGFQHSKVFLTNRDTGDGFFDQYRGNLNLRTIPVTYTAGRRKRTDSGFAAMKATEVLLYN